MKRGLLLIVGFLLLPNFSSAIEDVRTCSKEGYTIVTINGVFTTNKEADRNRRALEEQLLFPTYKNEKLKVDYLHNESHLAGLGDILKAVYQGIFDDETVKDYDLVEMIRAASEKVTTQKLLLVAHSQGNFYANSFYDYIKTTEATRKKNTEQTRNASPLSIGVYSVATPAGRVAGNGKWLTSDTDKVIAGVVGRVLSRKIMSPNTHIALGEGDDSFGHNFGSVYLKHEGARIISDIESSLDKLVSAELTQNTPSPVSPLEKGEMKEGPCIAAPELTLGHKAAGMAFAIADPAANAGRTAISGAVAGIYKVGLAVGNAGKSVAEKIAGVFGAPAEQSAAVVAAGADTATEFSTAEETPNSLSSEQRSDVLENIRTSEEADTRRTLSEQSSDRQATPQSSSETPSPRGLGTSPLKGAEGGEEENPPPAAPPLKKEETSPYYRLSPAGGGGGGVTNPPQPQTNADSTQTSADTTTSSSPAADTTAPDAPIISTPANNTTLTNTSVIFSGTTEASSTISTDFSNATTSAAAGGAWTLNLSLSQGTTTVGFYATDAAGNRGSAASTTVFVDSLVPDISFSVSECANSLSADSCLVATTTLSISFSSSASDLAYFTLDRNGSTETTTSTSSTATASDQATYTVRVSATDTSGNRSATTTQTVTVNVLPVVINEIAWAGTQASGSDEWIELYNNTSSTISLSNFKLFAGDLTPYLSLLGSIAPNSYYLIERKNTGETNETTQSSVLDVTADLWESFSFGLNNNGENMTLAYTPAGRATTTIDYVPRCGGNWCGGSSSDYTTMERYDASVAGTVSTNWYSHMSSTNNMSTSVKSGTDAGGNAIKGTPRSRNSVSHLIDPTYTLLVNKTLTSSNSPYLIDRFGLTVPSGKTLTIDPGVVIKITGENEPWIRVSGTINANGTAASPVVFTSFYDDEYGGDLNGDATSTTPAAANWRRIFIDTTSAGSSFTHTLVRYGGNNDISDPAAKKGAIGVDSATVSFSNLVVEKSGFHGLSLANSNSTVSTSRFSTSTNSSRAGLYVSGGSPAVSNSVFSGNYNGAILESTTASLASNTFVSNTQEAVYTTGIVGSFNANTGSGNGVNAILLGNGTTITASGATTTLSANTTLPYLVKSTATVAANSTLSFGVGVVVKGYDSRASNYGEIVVANGGKLHSSGTIASDIVFTSIRDTSADGTTESGLSAAAPGDWIGITVQAGGQVSLSGFTLKYAGARASLGFPVDAESAGALKITGGAATSSGSLSQALFENNYQSGLNLADVSALSVSNATFQNHAEKRFGSATGIYASNSTTTLSNITFSGNEKDGVGSGTNSLTCTNCNPVTPNTTPATLFTP